MITLLLMKRERNNAVTQLPVLIPTNQRDAEGFAAFQGEKNIMAEHEAKHFYAVTMLSRALGQSPDLLAIGKAHELLGEAYSLRIKSDESAGRCFPPFPEPENVEEERSSFARALAELLSVPPETNVKALFKGTAKSDPRWLLSFEISKAIQDAKLVLWWNGENFKPAIWCPDLKIAFYVRAIMGMFRICLHCGEPFLPERPDQDYCSVAHREAHRVARWRARQKKSKGSGRKQQTKRGEK
jgi:hypothetical protein